MNYREELHRTRPDYIVYNPIGGREPRWADPDFFWLNEQLLVVETRDGGLLATWTSEQLTPQRHRIACARSADGGKTWTSPQFLDGSGLGDCNHAAWQVPVLSKSGKAYCFYNYNAGRLDLGRGFTGDMRCRCSDDHGRTWSDPADFPVARGPTDHPEDAVPCNWISCFPAVRDGEGRVLMAFTRWASPASGVPGSNVSIKKVHSQCELMRIENLDEDPEPADLLIAWLNVESPITVPHETILDASFAQEPCLVALPDGRLLLAMRTNRGTIWHTLSEDGGRTWQETRPLLYSDGGEEISHPVAPCPIFTLKRGDYLLLYNNNDGYVFGAKSRWTVENRRPAFISRGEFRPHARQPIWWSQPRLFIDNDGVPIGPEGMGRLEAAAYPSLTELNGNRVLWYPDRKVFLLGKRISDRWMGALVPRGCSRRRFELDS